MDNYIPDARQQLAIYTITGVPSAIIGEWCISNCKRFLIKKETQ
jgi:hypothetical protein